MRNINRAAERDEGEVVSIGNRKTVLAAARSSSDRKSRGTTERTRCFGCGHLSLTALTAIL